jgi:hypothetical protein
LLDDQQSIVWRLVEVGGIAHDLVLSSLLYLGAICELGGVIHAHLSSLGLLLVEVHVAR